MGMGKDLLKTIQDLNNDTNLKQNEALALLRLIEYYNVDFGYSYPKYDDLKTAIKTTRNDTVSVALKGLVSKGYITIEKMSNNKNKYFIHKYLYFIETEEKAISAKEVVKKSTVKPVDSNGNKPLNNQLHIDDVLENNVVEISNYTGFNEDQSKELLSKSNGDKGKVINAFEYMRKQKNINDPFNYTKWAIEHNKLIVTPSYNPSAEHKEKELKFCSFEPREYDYKLLERKLLGWDTDLSNDPADYRTDHKTINFEGVC